MTLSALLRIKQRAKARLGSLWWYTAIQFLFSKVGDLINLYVGAFLIPAVITSDDLGAIAPLRMLMAFAVFPMGVLCGVALKFVNAFHVGDKRPMVKAVLRDLSAVAAVLSAIVVLSLWAGRDFALIRLKLSDPRIIWALAAAIVFTIWQTVPNMAVQGLMRFRHLILAGVVGPVVYLALMLALLSRLHIFGYMLAFVGSAAAGAIYLAWAIREYVRPGIVPASYREHWPEMKRYVLNAGSVALFIGLAAVVEPWAIRNFTSHMDSAGYYIAFMFGQIPLYLASAFLPFLFSLISERHERGEGTQALLGQSVAAMAAIGLPLVLLFALFGDRLLDLRPSWRQYAAYAPFLWKVGVISTLQGVIMAYVSHETACYRFGFVRFFLPILAVEMIVLYGCMGWAFFRPYVSPALWDGVEGLIGARLDFAIWVMMAARVLLAVPVIGRLLNAKRGE